MAFSEVTVVKVESSSFREQALEVIRSVYLTEKQWIASPENEIPEEPISFKTSWFLALINAKPVGVIRLTYDPVLEFPEELGVTLRKNIDLAQMAREYRWVEIGRFMIKPEFRRNIRVAIKLMRAATQEVVERGYTHFLTDVFESDPHSPLNFHTKILGFEIIGSHLRGELHCSSARIILTLDILRAYQRLKERKARLYHELTEGFREILEEKLRDKTWSAFKI